MSADSDPYDVDEECGAGGCPAEFTERSVEVVQLDSNPDTARLGS